MDSSKILEDAEECCSNESSWTMYIDSPDGELDSDAYEEDEAVEEKTKKAVKKDVEDADSDDSMTSDASSRPSCLRHLSEQIGRVPEQSKKGNKGRKHHQQGDKKLNEQINGKKIRAGKSKN